MADARHVLPRLQHDPELERSGRGEGRAADHAASDRGPRALGRSGARANGAGLACCLLAFGAFRTSGAQLGSTATLIVGVADARTGAALEGAEVVLVEAHRLARANGLGEATLPDVPRGKRRVRVRRLGYAPAEVDLAITGDTTGAVFRLDRVATELGAVNVAAEWVPPKMKDVEVRRKLGIGRFLTAEQLEKDRDRDFALVAAMRFPGLTTILDSTRTHRVLASARSALGFAGVQACYVVVYLDDLLLGTTDSDLIRTWDLAAVEYYTANQVPARYRTKGYGCGVLLLWSKWY